MQYWAVFSSVIFAVVLSTVAQQDDEVSDSLRSALDAVSRRQRDLANSKESSYYGLGPYRDDMFVMSPTEDNDDGQPENIGYGYQKSLPSNHHQGIFPSQPHMDSQDRQLVEKLALEYLENEFQPDKNGNQYYRLGDEEKRSSFRERDFPEHYSAILAKPSGGMKKRMPPVPTSFRERNHQHVGGTTEEKQRRFAATINRRLEQEMEDALNSEQLEHPQLAQSLYEQYKEHVSPVVDMEDLSERDMDDIFSYINTNSAQRKTADDPNMEKRYDYFSHGTLVNGGGIGYKKRSKQRLEQSEQPADGFLYSLKFVSPEYNREAVEGLRANDAMDLSGENDEDIVRLGLNGREPVAWLPLANPSEDSEDDDEPQSLLPHPESNEKKRYLYDRVLLKHKRSSNFFTSPPVLYHHVAGDVRTKKDASREPGTTDPKVATELTQIFAPAAGDTSNKIVPQIIGNHVVTKQKTVLSTVPPPTTPPPSQINDSNTEMTLAVDQSPKINISVIEDKPMDNGEEIEQPITMSRLEVPIEVKKKSIDWTDYFGIDRRRKKTGPKSSDAINNEWLMNQYYKTMALADGGNKRTVFRANKDNLEVKKAIRMPMQPFDTRIFDSEQSQHEKKSRSASDAEDLRIDNMDSKLRNIEDLIVNEAVKYTGSHEGATDSREIQEVKDKVMSRLAAAYNLEKMRRALSEFKSSLAAQKMSKYNPENRAKDHSEPMEHAKRVAVKKEVDRSPNVDTRFGDYVDRPVIENMSEGFMGGIMLQNSASECPILNNIVRKCRDVETSAGDENLAFLPLCTMHQICYTCGLPHGMHTNCDEMFLEKADTLCEGNVMCQKAALRGLVAMNRYLPTDVAGTLKCFNNFCASNVNWKLEGAMGAEHKK